MNRNDKIKRLVVKYQDSCLRATNKQSRRIFECITEDLESLLDKECEHIWLDGVAGSHTCFNCGETIEGHK